MATVHRILTLNAGSSSLKAAMYAVDTTEGLLGAAQVDRIGMSDGRIHITNAAGRVVDNRRLEAGDHATALQTVLAWLRQDPDLQRVDAVAHRVVHGGAFTDPRLITPDVRGALHRLLTVDPDHLPQTLAAIDTIGCTYPNVPQVACFDTAFHRSMPPVAQMYPLPPRFRDAGVRRYGFHGLSCESIMTALRTIDPAVADGRVIIAHLGNGASMTAVHHGASIDTTMGFSPAGGLMMGTRSGDLDPGVLLYALREEHLTAADLNGLINRNAGLLGVSGASPDMRDLLAREATDVRAAAAIALFGYLAKKSLGALMIALGDLDTLVFTGGIGEHSASIRERITRDLDAFGLSIDSERNAVDAPIISTTAGRVVVRVMTTNEDVILARHARRVLLADGADST